MSRECVPSNPLPQLTQSEADDLIRFKLRACADELDAAILAFRAAPSGTTLAALVGLWAAGKRSLEHAGANAHLRGPA